jgi:hypothetical protein
MDAPKCKLCGKPHYGQCHEFEGGAKAGKAREDSPARPKKKSSKIKLRGDFYTNPPAGYAERVAMLEGVVGELVERVDRMDARRRYQRELMRDRRKK